MKNELVINKSIDPSFFSKIVVFSSFVTVWQNILTFLVASRSERSKFYIRKKVFQKDKK